MNISRRTDRRNGILEMDCKNDGKVQTTEQGQNKQQKTGTKQTHNKHCDEHMAEVSKK